MGTVVSLIGSRLLERDLHYFTPTVIIYCIELQLPGRSGGQMELRF